MYRLSDIYDFYILETLDVLASDHVQRAGFPTHAMSRFQECLREAREELAVGLTNTVINYLTLVCFGEMRHAFRRCEAHYREIPIERDRSVAYDKAVTFDPESILVAASTLFNNYRWERSFGGTLWGHIADFALACKRGKTTMIFFVDHITDLVHNGGFAFDKSEALERAGLYADETEYMLKHFFDIKTFEDLLTSQHLYKYYCNKMTSRTRKMVQAFYRIFLKTEAPEDWYTARKSWPTFKPIEWGNAKIHELKYGVTFECPICHEISENTDAYQVGGVVLCWDCYHSLYWTCDWCGEIKSVEETNFSTDGFSKWCERCTTNYIKQCSGCGKFASPYNTFKIEDGKHLCRVCYQNHQNNLYEEAARERDDTW